MSFQQKNVTVSLSTFALILGLYVLRLAQMAQSNTLTAQNIFQTWGLVAVLAIAGTILASILSHIAGGVVHKIQTNQDPHIDGVQDERDETINLKGTRVAYTFSSIGVALSMLTFVLGQPPLVMFGSLIFFGLLAQIVADIWRLVLYRRGF